MLLDFSDYCSEDAKTYGTLVYYYDNMGYTDEDARLRAAQDMHDIDDEDCA